MNLVLKSIYAFSLVVAMTIILTATNIPIQTQTIIELVAKTNLYNLMFPEEKVYLHLDRPSYWTNDTIWFKAYLKNSPVADCNLHVELANSTGTIISRELFWAQHGLAYGDIVLNDTLSSGVYQIRAYTDWMRNFDSCWYFNENLIIWNLKDKNSRENARELKEHEIDFQFFPEGGTFVTGLTTRMAFKATDRNGLGLDVRGIVVDDLGNNLITFESGFKGMGSFMIQPKEGRKYSAIITVLDDFTMKVDFPDPNEEGVAMLIDSMDADSVKIQISEHVNSSASNSTGDFFVVAQNSGIVFMNMKIQLVNGASTFSIGKNILPTGIIQFTLFDHHLLPLCERLIFVNHHDFVDLKIEHDKKDYSKREQVHLDVKAFNKAGIPCFTNLSLSVYNTDNQLKREDYPNNILTQFLLKSKLKGIIESPAYYFKDDNLSTIQALDNVMLTHGYRRFEWKRITENQYPDIVYQPDSGLKIKGRVSTLMGNHPVPNAKVNLLFLKSSLGLNQTVCDSAGNFEFPDFYFNDTVSFTLDAKTENKKKSTFIELDRRAFVFPEFKFVPSDYQYMNYHYVDDEKVDILNSFSEEDLQKIKRKWRLGDTIMLNEVRVVKRKKDKSGKRPLRLYAKADWSMELDVEDDQLGNVYHQIENRFPGVSCKVFEETDSVSIRIDYQDSQPVLVLDGVPLIDGLEPGEAMRLISSIPQGAYDRIEIIKNAACYGKPEAGAICFFTKKGTFVRTSNSIGMKSSTIIGYSVIRKFYSPDYGTMPSSEIKDDFRNTLYWNPVVRTDSTGIARVSFYNSDQAGDVKIVVEGVSADGKLCRGVGYYKVK